MLSLGGLGPENAKKQTIIFTSSKFQNTFPAKYFYIKIIKKIKIYDSVDPDEMAHNEPPQLALHG